LVPFLGAVIVHPVLFLLTFAWGACFGAEQFIFHNDGTFSYGQQGGQNAMTTVGCYYLLTFGMLPLVVSATGAGLAVLVQLALPHCFRLMRFFSN
jgi:hypothetical protein